MKIIMYAKVYKSQTIKIQYTNFHETETQLCVHTRNDDTLKKNYVDGIMVHVA